MKCYVKNNSQTYYLFVFFFDCKIATIIEFFIDGCHVENYHVDFNGDHSVGFSKIIAYLKKNIFWPHFHVVLWLPRVSVNETFKRTVPTIIVLKSRVTSVYTDIAVCANSSCGHSCRSHWTCTVFVSRVVFLPERC